MSLRDVIEYLVADLASRRELIRDHALNQPDDAAGGADPPLPAALPVLLQSAGDDPGRDASCRPTDWKRVFTEARELGVLQLGLSGGEPLVRKDLEELAAHARGRGPVHDAGHLGPRASPARAPRRLQARPASSTSRSRSRTPTPRRAERIAGISVGQAEAGGRRAGAGAGIRLLGQRRAAPRQPRPHRARSSSWPRAGRRPAGAGQHAVLRLGAREPARRCMPTREQVEALAARSPRRPSSVPGARCRSSTCCPTITRAIPKAVLRRVGQRYLLVMPGRPRPALPRRDPYHHRSASTTSGSTRSTGSGSESPAFQAFRGDEWMKEPCRSCPRKARGLRRLPLSGVRAHRRRRRTPTRSAR